MKEDIVIHQENAQEEIDQGRRKENQVEEKNVNIEIEARIGRGNY